MKRICLCFLAALMLLAVGCSASAQLRVDFYNVGKADAMLITTPQGQRILIDAATNGEGKKLVKRFAAEGISTIDLMIITHFDKDHVGGADQMIENLTVSQVLIPEYEKDSKQYRQFIEAMEASRETHSVTMSTGQRLEFEAGGAQFVVTAAHRADYGQDEENDFSLVVRMTYGDTKFLFAGDAEAPRQKEILEEGDAACDVLKVPYHGRLTGMSEAFIAETSPKIAFVPDGEEDPASETVLSLLSEAGAAVYCARHGDVSVLSDGTSVWVE